MWPLLGLSVVALACALERGWFWFQLLRQEEQVVQEVFHAAQHDLQAAAAIARQAQTLPIARFLLAPLQLRHPTPETFRLALEAAGDKEFVQMRRGDKLLETVIAIAPLLGLLGTVTGLIVTFANLDIGNTAGTDTAKVAAGISEALVTTAAGMLIAILALVFFRSFAALQAQQIDYFSQVGSDLELLYRQVWYEPSLSPTFPPIPPAPADSLSPVPVEPS